MGIRKGKGLSRKVVMLNGKIKFMEVVVGQGTI